MAAFAVLCVDDQKVILDSLTEQLKRGLGITCEVEAAESGEEALELLADLEAEGIEVALVISDQIMPGMKGDELLAKVHQRYPNILKIMLTGQADMAAISRAVNAADLYRYMTKPWDDTDLALTAKEAIRRYAQDRQLAEQNAILQAMNAELRDLNSGLEQKVADRTIELTTANAQLQQEIHDRQRAEEVTTLILTLSQAITAAPDFETALELSLRTLCEVAGWAYGEVWVPSVDGQQLECSPIWYCDRQTASPTLITAVEALRARVIGATLGPHEGIAGRVWQQRQPEWVANIDQPNTVGGKALAPVRNPLLALHPAKHYGFKARFGVPILVPPSPYAAVQTETEEVFAVLVFFIEQSKPQDVRSRDLVSAVVAQLGSVMKQKQSEAELRALFSAMTDLIFVFDAEGRHLKIPQTNMSRLLYMPIQERIGKTLHDIFPKAQADLFLGYIHQALETQQTVNVEYSLMIGETETWSYGSVSPISPNTVIWVARDITDRKQAEQALQVEQEKSENLLLNILPHPIAQQLKQNQRAIAEHFDDVTILFADIVNFTPWSSRLSPIELVNCLNQIFSQFDQLADQLGLEKIKTIGDAYMVVGGLPTPHADHAIAIAEMALQMQMVIRQFCRDTGEPIQLRIGINTGTVVAGVIGTKKFIYDLWGDAVNLAARMESQGLPSKIQVTAATYELLRDRYQLEERGLIAVKGKGSMRTYWLHGRQGAGSGWVNGSPGCRMCQALS